MFFFLHTYREKDRDRDRENEKTRLTNNNNIMTTLLLYNCQCYYAANRHQFSNINIVARFHRGFFFHLLLVIIAFPSLHF